MKLKNYTSLFLLWMIAGLFVACSNSRETLAEESSLTDYDSASDAPGAYNATTTEVVTAKNRLREQLNQHLDKVDDQIEALEDEAKNLSANAKASYQKTVDDLDIQRERIVGQYRRLDEASSDNWEEVKTEISEVMQDVDQKMTNLVAELKQ